MNLTILENEILSVIALAHPYSISDVTTVYMRCKSLDITIKVLQEAIAKGINWNSILLQKGL